MTYEEFQLLNEFISDLIGVSFPAERGRLLESRLRPRVQALHLPRFMDYYFVLQYNIEDEAEHASVNYTIDNDYMRQLVELRFTDKTGWSRVLLTIVLTGIVASVWRNARVEVLAAGAAIITTRRIRESGASPLAGSVRSPM